ncbi:hypothetical protein EHP00_2327 [Ecytonucleospora hepatopenaei]|uniref:Uncharacterized protein n=1 Tax=Ecytonucleospora hepatopenaei TaxID=646526 RepID=A0A1W0E694_9MICR|nr:hypothetical protein EHP00_2327 [Ecytonucleospora hepatopenaei]
MHIYYLKQKISPTSLKFSNTTNATSKIKRIYTDVDYKEIEFESIDNITYLFYNIDINNTNINNTNICNNLLYTDLFINLMNGNSYYANTTTYDSYAIYMEYKEYNRKIAHELAVEYKIREDDLLIVNDSNLLLVGYYLSTEYGINSKIAYRNIPFDAYFIYKVPYYRELLDNSILYNNNSNILNNNNINNNTNTNNINNNNINNNNLYNGNIQVFFNSIQSLTNFNTYITRHIDMDIIYNNNYISEYVNKHKIYKIIKKIHKNSIKDNSNNNIKDNGNNSNNKVLIVDKEYLLDIESILINNTNICNNTNNICNNICNTNYNILYIIRIDIDYNTEIDRLIQYYQKTYHMIDITIISNIDALVLAMAHTDVLYMGSRYIHYAKCMGIKVHNGKYDIENRKYDMIDYNIIDYNINNSLLDNTTNTYNTTNSLLDDNTNNTYNSLLDDNNNLIQSHYVLNDFEYTKIFLDMNNCKLKIKKNKEYKLIKKYNKIQKKINKKLNRNILIIEDNTNTNINNSNNTNTNSNANNININNSNRLNTKSNNTNSNRFNMLMSLFTNSNHKSIYREYIQPDRLTKEFIHNTMGVVHRCLLDYDGTLMGIMPNPWLAVPTVKLLEFLKKHSGKIVLCTGRGKEVIDEWFPVGIEIYAEHGALFRNRKGEWEVPAYVSKGNRQRLNLEKLHQSINESKSINSNINTNNNINSNTNNNTDNNINSNITGNDSINTKKDIAKKLILENTSNNNNTNNNTNSNTNTNNNTNTTFNNPLHSNVIDILDYYHIRLPGSVLEKKTCGYAFHYKALKDNTSKNHIMYADTIVRHLYNDLAKVSGIYDFELAKGKGVIEVRLASKGDVVHIVRPSLVAGDDLTDEQMFLEADPACYTIKIGKEETRARHYVEDVDEFVGLLEEILDRPKQEIVEIERNRNDSKELL